MDTYGNVSTAQEKNITVSYDIWTQINTDIENFKKIIAELQESNEKLKCQLSQIKGNVEINTSSPKKILKVTKEVARTSTKIYKPPPITACGVNDIKKFIDNLAIEEASGHEQQLKTLANGDIKILTGDEHQFRRTVKILEEQKIEYHRYQLKSEKMFRVVIRGLHPETDICDIKRDLSDQGHLANHVSNIQIKKKVDSKNKNSDWTFIRLPLFFVDLEPQDNNKDIYQLKKLSHQIIKVEPPKKTKGVPQCKNCQLFGHTLNYCHKSPNCVKCGEKHRSIDCTKSKKTKSKCANCGENHTANWKGCAAYKKAVEISHPKKTTAVQRLQSKPAKSVTTSISYAEMAGSSVQNLKIPQTFEQKNHVKNEEVPFVEVINSLASITQTLAMLTERLDRLENNQPKPKNKRKNNKK